MADEQKGVEGVKKTDNAPDPSNQVAPTDDPEVKLNEALAKLDQMTRDRDNYRTAVLSMKGKKDGEQALDLTDPEHMQSLINKTVEERLLLERQASAESGIVEYARELARKNKELALALASKGSVTNAGSGASGSSGAGNAIETQNSYFSPEQVADLKKRGFTDDMVKKAEENTKKAANGGL